MHGRLWTFCFFLLVTSHLLPRHLALAVLLPVRSSSEDTSASSVEWSSPASGDRFGPGDTIVGEWRVTGQKVVSPSFRLCAGGEDGCGATIWPEVIEESGGSYSVSLTAPNVTKESGYSLQMKDDFGRTYTSPVFNLTPIPPNQKKSKPSAHPPDVAQPRPNQAPLSSSYSTTNSNPAVAAPADPGGGTLTLPSAAGIPPNSTATWTPVGNGGPLIATAHNAPPTAALAIPLSLTGAIVLLAGGFALHHRRKLTAEKERCAARQQLVSTSEVASSSSSPTTTTSLESSARRPLRSVGLGLDDLGGRRGRGSDRGDGTGTGTHVVVDDAEKAFFARALFRGGFLDHIFDAYHNNDNDNNRRSESEAAAPAAASATAAAAAAADRSSYRPPYAPSYSSYAYRAPPEPRQRTHQLDLFTREFSTRPRAHLSSSSSYRGLFGSRHSARLTTTSSRSNNNNNNNNNNGGGGPRSHWRSLSFARRKVAPRLALTSPAMTESVTSEVLPSYLPSPNFVGAAGQLGGCEHGASIGDSGFENVPLSPPPPPPLHTRGEAAEPDDSRMRELRGVYEAVARALGSVNRV